MLEPVLSLISVFLEPTCERTKAYDEFREIDDSFSSVDVLFNSGAGSEDNRLVTQRAEQSEDTKGQFEELLNAYQERLTNKNVDGILELYSADPVFMPEYAPPAVGREAVRKAYEWVFATLNLKGQFIVHEAEIIGDTAWVRTNSTGRFTVIATGIEADVANSEFFLFKHEKGDWKIHRYIFTASAPLPETKKSNALSDVNEIIVRPAAGTQ